MDREKIKKINILGSEYTIEIDVPEKDMPEDADGCMDCSTRTIKLMKIEADRNSVQNLDSYMKKVLRHEIIHAFLYESGLWGSSGSVDHWAQSEEITDWIAIQSPKMLKVFEEAGCL